MPNTNFLQVSVARLIERGIWFSDAVELINTIFPQGHIPPNWEDEWYDVVRNINSTKTIPIPNYKTIW